MYKHLYAIIDSAGCLYNGREHANGATFEDVSDPCATCVCRDGTVRCERRHCSPPNCPFPVQGHCCPHCDGLCVFVYPFTLIYMINSVMIALISQLMVSLCRVYSQAVCMAMWNIRMVRSSQTPAITAAVACAWMVTSPAIEGSVGIQGVATRSLGQTSAVLCVMVKKLHLCIWQTITSYQYVGTEHQVIKYMNSCMWCNDTHTSHHICVYFKGCLYHERVYADGETFPSPTASCEECTCSVNTHLVLIPHLFNVHHCKNSLFTFSTIVYISSLLRVFFNCVSQCVCHQRGDVRCYPRNCQTVPCPHPVQDPCACGVCEGCSYNGRDCGNGERFPDPNNHCQGCTCLVHTHHTLLP